MIAHSSPLEHSIVLVVGCAAVGVYASGWLRSPHPKWGRLLAWAGGVASALAATSPPVERLAGESFTGHMVQHLILLVVAPPLLVLSHPVTTMRPVILQGKVRRGRRVERSIARRWRRWAAVVMPICFLVVMFGTHLTAFYNAALQHRVLHDVEHIAYLATAIGLWSVVLAPVGALAFGRVGAACAVIAGTAILGLVLTSANRPLVDAYIDLLGTDDALDDQRLAASLMWVGGMALGLPLVMVSVWRWASVEHRNAVESERLLDARHRVP